MSGKKPASLTGDLLARKGEAKPLSLDPEARATQPADHGLAASLTGGRPKAPEPDIIFSSDHFDREAATTRSPNWLLAGGVAAVALIGGAFLAVTINGPQERSVAPIAELETPDAGNPDGPTVASGELAPSESGYIVLGEPVRPKATVPSATSIDNLLRAPAVASPDLMGMPAQPSSPAVSGTASETAAADAEEDLITGSVERAGADLRTATPTDTDALSITAASRPLPTAPLPSSKEPPAAAKPVDLRPSTAEQPAPQKLAALAPAAETPPARANVSERPSGPYVLQLMSVRAEADARQSWAKLQKKHPGLLGDLDLSVERADLGDKGIYYRVRTGGFDKQGANALCRDLKAAGQDCLVMRSSKG